MKKINRISAQLASFLKPLKNFKNLKLLKIPTILTIIFALSSCSDYLDVRPENQILLDDFWQKGSDVEAVVLACYRAMQEDAFMYRLITWGELRSDNVIAAGSAGDAEKQINNVNILATNGNCSWASFYMVINYCNLVLKYAPVVVERDPNFTESDRQAKEAEVLAIRSLCYFYLVRTFRDVPLVLEATISDDQVLFVPQSSPEEVLKKITEDLLQAETWAMSSYATPRDTKGRITKDAIRAILADVYLWKQEYTACIDYCDKLINATTTLGFAGTTVERPKYELIEDDLFSFDIFDNGNASESIFELQFSSEKWNAAVYDFYGHSGTIGQMTTTALYAEGETLYKTADMRKVDYIRFPKSDGGEYPIFKYMGSRMGENAYLYKATTANWIFYRITDVMLMKAEALVQLNRSETDLKEALHIVNTTYVRANPSQLEGDTIKYEENANAVSMEKLVLLERQRELIFEGKRWFDLVRHSERKNSTGELVDYVMTKYTANQSTIRSKLSVMNALYLPIHADELKVNPLLKQNPYYQTSSTIEKN
ncbi:MAG: RagB/SusD family nutrient uptake outer membrane protein [Candidatus Ordinivivax streblomastigis]|uniref:RagB/SusD family nutrient uptake outer membrane protein n=1 Tax=Candidatus Ordinivivax streblomastigis TaxID=2540710 RepID=A0A5M8P2Q8_9BACT|nr:MAG: RagB/SusD family nutrient uptake outer membrane protein [Candidatus Ordinivivax streblomastigis]